MKCKGCGAQLSGTENFCPYCRCRVEQAPQAQPTPMPEQHIHIHVDNAGGNQQYNPHQSGNAPYYGGGYNPGGYNPVYGQPPMPPMPQNPYGGNPYPTKSNRSRIAMLLLAFFLGYLGIHWFYTGHNGKGVLYLLTGGLCGIGVLVDLIIILIGMPKDSSGLPIQW